MKLALVSFKYGVDINDPCIFPLGFMYISACLKELGHQVVVINENLSGAGTARTVDYSLYNAVLMTGFEEHKPHIIETATVCRRLGVKTILGGALATYCPDEMLKYVDTVVLGEGEPVMRQALKEKGKIYGCKPDLSTLPLPDYEGYGIQEYNRIHAQRYMGVLTSRGCPFHCRFCAHICAYQERSLESVSAEIGCYQDRYGVETIVFNDNTLNVRKRRFLEICEMMQGRGLRWSAAIRCDQFDEETARAAKDSGACYFVVGVESFRQEKLDAMNKRLQREQIIRTLDLLHDHQIDYHGNVMFGLPGETTLDVLDELMEMPKKYNVLPVFVQGFVGTDLAGKSAISREDRQKFDGYFRELVVVKGKYCYPELAHV